jgi:hypothetical protein
VSGVPQAAQNVRTTAGDERNSAGLSFVKRNPADGNVTQATTGEAAARRQDWQWQTMVLEHAPSAS